MTAGSLLTLSSCLLPPESGGREQYPTGTPPFDGSVTHLNVAFFVSCDNASSWNELVIRPAGFAIDQTVVRQQVAGVVTKAQAGDLDGNGLPEVYINVFSTDANAYGTIVAYSVNIGEPMTPIQIDDLSANRSHRSGYRGRDQFSVVGESLVRRFPIYRQTDSDNQPTGGIRELWYQLYPGESQSRLQFVFRTFFIFSKSTEFRVKIFTRDCAVCKSASAEPNTIIIGAFLAMLWKKLRIANCGLTFFLEPRNQDFCRAQTTWILKEFLVDFVCMHPSLKSQAGFVLEILIIPSL